MSELHRPIHEPARPIIIALLAECFVQQSQYPRSLTGGARLLK